MFDSRNQKTNDHIPILNPVTTSNYTYNSYQHANMPKNDVQEMSQHVDYGADEDDDNDVSGVSSPPLWKSIRPRGPVNPLDSSMNHRSVSSSSRALVIAKGQWELMEMVKNMPESCYELSLKDLVEKNENLESDQEACLINKEEESFTTTDQEQVLQQRVQESGRDKSNDHQKKGKMIRNEIEDKGLFLKMFLPVSLESKKKQMKPKITNPKVSPKPSSESSSDKSSRNLEKDWWKKRFSCSSESDSSKTGSSNSESTGRSGRCGSSGRRKSTNRKKKGFFWSRLCF